MFRIAICDDEPHFREQMKEMLMQYMQDSGVYYEIDNFQSGKELLELGIELNQYKIIFLDINMDEMDGIQTAKKIREQNTELFLVFVTAFVNYSLERLNLKKLTKKINRKDLQLLWLWGMLTTERLLFWTESVMQM